MRRTIWVGLVCCLAFFLLFTAESGTAKDITSDVDMSTKIGCGVTEPHDSSPEHANSSGDVGSAEKERDEGEGGPDLGLFTECWAVLRIWICSITHFGGVIRLAVI